MTGRISITSQIVILVTGITLLLVLAMYAVTMSGPPPKRAPVHVDDMARILAGRANGLVRRDGLRLTISEKPMALPADMVRNTGMERQLQGRLPAGFSDIAVWQDADIGTPPQHSPMMKSELRGHFVIRAQLNEQWRQLVQPPEPWLSDWNRVTLAISLSIWLLVSLAGWLLARSITRPIMQLQALSTRQERTPHDEFVPNFATAPPEIRALAARIMVMQHDLLSNIEERTAMMVALAHDLGTPLTRLAFRMRHMPQDRQDPAMADIDEMRIMTADILAFARSEVRTPVSFDLAALIERVIADQRAISGVERLSCTMPQDEDGALIFEGDVTNLRRLVQNLIDNGLRYGDMVHVTLQRGKDCVILWVDDAGPGIPPDQAETLFKPFERGEASRNRQTGGTGLGLTIARSIARANGGDVSISPHPGSLGGARLEVILAFCGKPR